MVFLIIMKLVFGLIGLLLVVCLFGKKFMLEIILFDLVYMFVLGGILEELIYDDNVYVGYVLFVIVFWVVMIYGIECIV